MNRKNMPMFALVAGVAAIAALWAGVSASTIVLLALVLACPLMMVFMHGGGGHGGGGHGGGGHAGHGAGPDGRDASATHHHDPAAGQERPEPIDPVTRR